MSNPWFRMYHEFATDQKVQMLSEADQRRYVMLLCLRCSNEGVTLHDDEVAFLLRITDEEWQATKVVLLRKNLIDEDNLPTNWDKRQFKSDNCKERVRACRKRKKERELALKMASDAAREADGNACNVTVTAPDTETDTYTQDAREINERARDAVSELLEKSSAEGRAPPGAISKPWTGKFLMAEDWEPSDSYLGLQVAAGHDPKDLDWIVSEFVDYWTFTPDKNHLRDQTGWELLLSAQIKLKSKPKSKPKSGYSVQKKTQNGQSSGDNRHFGGRVVQSPPKAWSQAYRTFDTKKPEPVTEEVRRRTQAAYSAAMAKVGKLTGSRSARGANP